MIKSLTVVAMFATACGGIVEYPAERAPVTQQAQDAGADAAAADAGDNPCPGLCVGCLGGNPCRPYCYTCMR